MPDLTPETLAELQRLLDAATPGPWSTVSGAGNVWHFPEEGTPTVVAGHQRAPRVPDAELIAAAVNLLPALLGAAAERDQLRAMVRSYGRTIDRWGKLIIAATASEDITTPDGDGDWQVIEERLAEVPALLAERDALAAAVERVRALHADSGETQTQGYRVVDGRWGYGYLTHYCTGCEASDEYGVPYPCPTIRALDGGEP